MAASCEVLRPWLGKGCMVGVCLLLEGGWVGKGEGSNMTELVMICW